MPPNPPDANSHNGGMYEAPYKVVVRTGSMSAMDAMSPSSQSDLLCDSKFETLEKQVEPMEPMEPMEKLEKLEKMEKMEPMNLFNTRSKESTDLEKQEIEKQVHEEEEMETQCFPWTASEKRNLFFYILGIICYKFVLESMNANFNGIVLNRLKSGDNPATVWANMQGVNLGMQCIGSLSVGVLIKNFYANRVMAAAVFGFALVTIISPILEGCTGGRLPKDAGSKNAAYWGTWTPYAIYGIYGGCGFCSGVIEVMRRVVPAYIMGGSPAKLKKMDATVHIFNEITGTVGAVFAYIWIGWFGWGYCLGLLPIGFTLASIFWLSVQPRPEAVAMMSEYREGQRSKSYCTSLKEVFIAFFYSFWFGAKTVCTQRALVWLLPAYTLPLILHRYLENSLLPFFAKSNFKNSDLQTIMVGGSNFGELLGAILVFFTASYVKTPIPYLRLDALLLLIIWVLPYFPNTDTSCYSCTAWKLAPIMTCISLGWSAGDVSLVAYVQSRLNKYAAIDKYTTPLGAVMAFLYVSSLVGYYLLNLGMSIVRDNYVNNKKDLTTLYNLIGGTFMTCAAFVVFAATFIPRGSWHMNPDPDEVVFDTAIIVDGHALERKGKNANEDDLAHEMETIIRT